MEHGINARSLLSNAGFGLQPVQLDMTKSLRDQLQELDEMGAFNDHDVEMGDIDDEESGVEGDHDFDRDREWSESESESEDEKPKAAQVKATPKKAASSSSDESSESSSEDEAPAKPKAAAVLTAAEHSRANHTNNIRTKHQHIRKF